MTQLSDSQLLERIRADHDRAALDALVRRYIDSVYSSALRQVRDPHLAEDITQAVFIVLLRQVRSIRKDRVLAAWLFTVTRHAAANAIRVRNRQRNHEMQKMLQTSEENVPADPIIATEIREHLDDAIASLPSIERTGVLLHFFSNQTHKQVGESLGMSEEAARKRVGRGLDKVRAMLNARGIGVASASTLAGALSICPAPAALAGSTVNVALLSNGIANSSTAAIAQGVSRMIVLSKIKVAAAIIASVLLAGGIASPVVSHVLRDGVFVHETLVTTLIDTRVPATQPANTPQFVAEVDKDTHIEFLGVTKYPPEVDGWNALNGEAIEAPETPVSQGNIATQPPPDFMILAKVTKPQSTIMRMRVPGSGMSAVIQSDGDEGNFIAVAFANEAGGNTAKLELGISEGKWKDVATNDKPKQDVSSDAPDIGAVTIRAIEEDGEKTSVIVEYSNTDLPTQIVVIDEKGEEHRADNINVRSDGQSQTVTCTFAVAGVAVKKVAFQIRPFSKFVDITDISLDRGTITHPKITVRDAKDGK